MPTQMTMTTASLTERARGGAVSEHHEGPAAKPTLRKFSRAETECIVDERGSLVKGSPGRV